MTKEDNLRLQELSLKVFKKKYFYKKMMTKGIILGHDQATGIPRRMPLTAEQTEKYMVNYLKLQEEKANAKG